MNDGDVLSAGMAPRVAGTMLVALYDPASGRIRHLHHVFVHEGAAEVTESMAIEAANRIALALGHETSGLEAAVSRNPQDRTGPYRVDVETGEFVREPNEPHDLRQTGGPR